MQLSPTETITRSSGREITRVL